MKIEHDGRTLEATPGDTKLFAYTGWYRTELHESELPPPKEYELEIWEDELPHPRYLEAMSRKREMDGKQYYIDEEGVVFEWRSGDGGWEKSYSADLAGDGKCRKPFYFEGKLYLNLGGCSSDRDHGMFLCNQVIPIAEWDGGETFSKPRWRHEEGSYHRLRVTGPKSVGDVVIVEPGVWFYVKEYDQRLAAAPKPKGKPTQLELF